MYRLAACSLPARFSMRSRNWETYTLSCPALKLNEICPYMLYPNTIYVVVIDAATSVTLMQCSPPFHLKQSFSQRGLNKVLEAFKGSSAFDGWITSDIFWSNLSETFTVAAHYLSIYLFYSCQQRLANFASSWHPWCWNLAKYFKR